MIDPGDPGDPPWPVSRSTTT